MSDVTRPAVIAVDFDGTLCDHRFPDIGPEVPRAFAVLKELQAAGHRLILWTMRDDDRLGDTPDQDRVLGKAVEWCRERGVEFWGVNANGEQRTWSLSPKCYAHLYIDDAALGCPLTRMTGGGRPVVDWVRVRAQLVRAGLLKARQPGRPRKAAA